MTTVEQCKGKVYRNGGWSPSRCSRKAVSDGYCTQHHPDTRARLDMERSERVKAECAYRTSQREKREAKIARLIELSCEEARQIIAELNLR